ncbi:MAG: trypsin-like serine protease [Polyangiaceae bacterium]
MSRATCLLAAAAAVTAVAFLLPSCAVGAGASPPDTIIVSEALEVAGVDDNGLDPSVVSLANGWGGHCSGVLLASDVVLTARRCVTAEPGVVECAASGALLPPPSAPATADPATIHVYAGAPGGTWASAGVAILTSDAPGICGADLAVVVLAWPIDGAIASIVSESGIAQGAFVRTVGLALPTTDGAETELMREHLPVLAVSSSEFGVAEATCLGEPGGVAFDETTGEIVGVMSRWGSPCGAADEYDVFTRSDAFYGLIEDALAWEPSLATLATALDGGAEHRVDAGKKRDAGKAKKPVTDIGATCSTWADCGTGLCVTAEGSQYCSRTCSPSDRCPTDFTCEIASEGESVCVDS